MGTSQKKGPNSSPTENELSPDQTLGLVSLSLMQKLSQKDPSFSWLVDDKSDKANLKNLRASASLVFRTAPLGVLSAPGPRVWDRLGTRLNLTRTKK